MFEHECVENIVKRYVKRLLQSTTAELSAYSSKLISQQEVHLPLTSLYVWSFLWKQIHSGYCRQDSATTIFELGGWFLGVSECW